MEDIISQVIYCPYCGESLLEQKSMDSCESCFKQIKAAGSHNVSSVQQHALDDTVIAHGIPVSGQAIPMQP